MKIEAGLAQTAAPMPGEQWIETLPFPETRSYVQRILGHAVVFARLRDPEQPFDLANALAPIGGAP